MKNKIYFIFLMLATGCLPVTRLSAQVYTAGRITVTAMPSAIHDSTICSSSGGTFYFVDIASSFVGDSVSVVDSITGSLLFSAKNTTGASPWTSMVPIPMIIGTLPDYNLWGGVAYFRGPVTKVISGLDTVKYINNDVFLAVSNPCQYSDITGKVYIDNNSNCVYDGGDVALNGVKMEYDENLFGTIPTRNDLTYSSPTGYGFYNRIQLSWMNNCTVHLPSYYPFIFPYSYCFTGYSPFTSLPQSGIDFPLQCTGNVDVECYAFSPAAVRVGRSFDMQPFVNNTGCDSASGTLTLVLDSRVIYDPSLSTHPADTVRGDTLIWVYNKLTNLTGSGYWNSFLSNIHLTPDITVAVGDLLCFRVYTNIPTLDMNPSNNDHTICIPVVYSYDPNNKQVSPQGTGPQGYIPAVPTTFTYTLHFQNTGTAVAENISVIDTLDSHLDASSFRITGASANMTPEWLAPGIVKFNFNNIYLPDSTSNEPASHGAVQFTVALKLGLTPGTEIKNTGYIYFDANPPVVTNTTLNTIAAPTRATITNTTSVVKIYPNPATDKITVEHLNGGELSIVDVNGAVVSRQAILNDKATIDVSGLDNGVYLLKTVNNGNTTMNKFTKY